MKIDWQFEFTVLFMSLLLVCMLFIIFVIAGMFISWDYQFAFEMFSWEVVRILIVLSMFAYGIIRLRDL